MVVDVLANDRQSEWNEFIRSLPTPGFLQSWEWGAFKQKMGWKSFCVTVREYGRIIAGANLLIKPIPPGITSVAYLPRGPLGCWQDAHVFPLLISAIHDISTRNHAVFLKIEPDLISNPVNACFFEQIGFRFSSATNQPRCTIQMDLTGDLDTIFSQFRKSTRRKIKTALSRGVVIRSGTLEDLPVFYDLLKLTSERGGFCLRSFEYYHNEWQTFAQHDQALMTLAYYEDAPVAAHVNYHFGNHAAFFHQASSNDCGQLNPNSLLVWQNIQLLRERGCTNYDLWGIPDEVGEVVSRGCEMPDHERTDGLWGPYQFKSGFSKNVVYYLGAYDYVYQPVLYSMINNRIFNANMLEQVSSMIDRSVH